jgi:cytochrome c oxidase subunit 2
VTAPLAYLSGAGPKAVATAGLTWGLMAISVAVVLIVTALVVAGVLLRRSQGKEPPPVARGGDGLRWIQVGTGLTALTLLGSLVWTLQTLAAVNDPGRPPGLAIEVTGEQWWWRVRYLDPDPARSFVTANEIHIPTGRPVRVLLKGGDVIHSFWVPQLAGKTDAIPGQTNLTWIQADRPGVYRGQCAEYCGVQHAHMALEVVAESPAAFEAWRRAQLVPAADPTEAGAQRGRLVFVRRCADCHTVRGVVARDRRGPDLTHLMSRRTLAAGTLPNNGATLAGWVGAPQALKPGTRMPTPYLWGAELSDIRSYLVTLR